MTKQGTSRRAVLAGTLAAGAAIAVPNVVRAKNVINWNVQSHWPAASTSFTESLTVTRDVLAERSGGRLKLQFFGSGELFEGAEIFAAVRSGLIEMGSVSPSYLLAEAKSANVVFGMPGSFRETSVGNSATVTPFSF